MEITNAVVWAAAEAAFSAFKLHVSKQAPLDLVTIDALKICGRVPSIKKALREELIDHYNSPVGEQERIKSPYYEMPVEDVVDLLMREIG